MSRHPAYSAKPFFLPVVFPVFLSQHDLQQFSHGIHIAFLPGYLPLSELFPIVSILAAFCHGRSNIQGFKRLASKESDRGTAILNMLTLMGVSASASGDTLTIDGESVESRLLNGHLLKGGEYTSSHDHRMAMALTVASWCADTPIIIDDTTCVAKSFPAFLDTYAKLKR